MMDSMEQWRALQLAGLRESYNQQVAGIKDSCYQQVERIRDTYKGQARYMSDMRDYGAQQIEGFREQYLDQVGRGETGEERREGGERYNFYKSVMHTDRTSLFREYLNVTV